jgi:hypothetical protein
MKGMFPDYDDVDDSYRAFTWKNALFVFDTNVLLNLYRVSRDASDDIIKTLQRVKDRTWLPYHVALEFARKRLQVVRSEIAAYTKVTTGLQARIEALILEIDKLVPDRHRSIDSTALKGKIRSALDECEKLLRDQSRQQEEEMATDHIKAQLEAVFNERVGHAPTHEEFKKLCAEADRRAKARIPPGYEDEGKGDNEFLHDGLSYLSRHGDYLIWSQTLAHAKQDALKALIFVTEDQKEDWWLIASGQRLGPRPELRNEARNAGLSHFLLYSTDRFLSHARQFIGADEPQPKTLDEIKALRVARSSNPNEQLRDSVADWVSKELDAAMIAARANSHTEFTALTNFGELDFVIKRGHVIGEILTYITEYNRHERSAEHSEWKRPHVLVILYPGAGSLAAAYNSYTSSGASWHADPLMCVVVGKYRLVANPVRVVFEPHPAFDIRFIAKQLLQTTA